MDIEISKIEKREVMIAPSKNEQAMEKYLTGSQFLEENKLNEAESHLKEAIALDSLFVDAMDHLGMVYRRQNRLQEAEEIYLRSIGLNNKNIVSYQNLAAVYRIQNRLRDALELYMKMIEINEYNPEPYYAMGELSFTVEEYENSMKLFDIAIKLYMESNPLNVFDAFYYKGMIYFKLKKWDEALYWLEAAQKGILPEKVKISIKNKIDEIKNKTI